MSENPAPEMFGLPDVRSAQAPVASAEVQLPLASPEAGDGHDTVALLAAALRADSSDLAAYERVLFASLADGLPPGVVDVDRSRSVSDRMAGRPGRPTAIRVHLGDETLELAEGRTSPVARIARDVRGVTISRREVSIAEWSERLAELLAKLASESSATRDALARMLGTS